MKNQSFTTEVYNFNLPKKLIAQYPLPERENAKLLVYNRKTDKIIHTIFKNISNFIDKGDCIVLNNTKVIPARLYGFKPTGGKIEILITRIESENIAFGLIKNIKIATQKKFFIDSLPCEIVGYDETFGFKILFPENIENIIKKSGNLPLPPYIKRKPEDFDFDYYQTVYAKNLGSIAAPTAGLHFSKNLIEELKSKEVKIVEITLHIGAFSFKKIKSDFIYEHKVNPEFVIISQDVATKINKIKNSKNKIFAVGTSVVRALETSCENGKVSPQHNYTGLFIYPGYNFKIVDGLITNFHLPKSSHFVLVSAFVNGVEKLKKIYKKAIEKNYRFYSYGDAMLII